MCNISKTSTDSKPSLPSLEEWLCLLLEVVATLCVSRTSEYIFSLTQLKNGVRLRLKPPVLQMWLCQKIALSYHSGYHQWTAFQLHSTSLIRDGRVMSPMDNLASTQQHGVISNTSTLWTYLLTANVTTCRKSDTGEKAHCMGNDGLLPWLPTAEDVMEFSHPIEHYPTKLDTGGLTKRRRENTTEPSFIRSKQYNSHAVAAKPRDSTVNFTNTDIRNVTYRNIRTLVS